MIHNSEPKTWFSAFPATIGCGSAYYPSLSDTRDHSCSEATFEKVTWWCFFLQIKNRKGRVFAAAYHNQVLSHGSNTAKYERQLCCAAAGNEDPPWSDTPAGTQTVSRSVRLPGVTERFCFHNAGRNKFELKNLPILLIYSSFAARARSKFIYCFIASHSLASSLRKSLNGTSFGLQRYVRFFCDRKHEQNMNRSYGLHV